MSKLSAPIIDFPVRIEAIDLARKVDDSFDEDSISIVREFNVRTNGSRQELNVFHVLDVAPEFTPGRVVGNRKIRNIKLTETESNSVYTLEVEHIWYDYKSPFKIPIDWEWESSELEIPAYADYKGRPLVTKAGEPIIGQTKRLKLWILNGTRQVPGVPKWFRTHGVSVNSDVVKIDGEDFDKLSLQLQKIKLGKYEESNVDGKDFVSRPLSLEMWFNPIGWTRELFHMGFYELLVRKTTNQFTAKTELKTFAVRCTDSQGNPTAERVFLNKDGQRPRDKDGNVKTVLDPKDIYTLKFDLEEQLPFAPLLK